MFIPIINIDETIIFFFIDNKILRDLLKKNVNISVLLFINIKQIIYFNFNFFIHIH